jgi:hypothetical protein
MYYQAAAGISAISIGLTGPGGGVPFLIARVLLVLAGALFTAYALTLIVLVLAARGRKPAPLVPRTAAEPRS